MRGCSAAHWREGRGSVCGGESCCEGVCLQEEACVGFEGRRENGEEIWGRKSRRKRRSVGHGLGKNQEKRRRRKGGKEKKWAEAREKKKEK